MTKRTGYRQIGGARVPISGIVKMKDDFSQAAVLEERRQIVAWLRRSGAVYPGAPWFDSATKAADCIERGDHLEQDKAK